jgi:ADP-ribose pyrophosphatase YjhB (NUDIX family)
MDLRTHGVVALVRNNDGNFLLLEDAREATKGWWAPPHGSCEVADGREENSVIREVKEETNLVVTPLRKLLTQAADTKRKTVSFWLVETKDGEIVLNDESSRSGWFTLDEALRLTLYPGTKTFFEKIQRGEISLG